MALSVEHLKKVEEMKKCYGVSYGKSVNFDSINDTFRNSKVKRSASYRGVTRSKTYIDIETDRTIDKSLSYLSLDGRSVSSTSTGGMLSYDESTHTKGCMDSLLVSKNKAGDKNHSRKTRPIGIMKDTKEKIQNFTSTDSNQESGNTPRTGKTTRSVKRTRSFNDVTHYSTGRSVTFIDAINLDTISAEVQITHDCSTSSQKSRSLVRNPNLNETQETKSKMHSPPSTTPTKELSSPLRDVRRTRSFCDSTGKHSFVNRSIKLYDNLQNEKNCIQMGRDTETSHSSSNSINHKALNGPLNHSPSTNIKSQYDPTSIARYEETQLVPYADPLPEVRAPRGIQRSYSLHDRTNKPKVLKRGNKICERLHLEILSPEIHNVSYTLPDLKGSSIPKENRHSPDKITLTKHQTHSARVSKQVNIVDVSTTDHISAPKQLGDVKKPKYVQRSQSLRDAKSKPIVVKRKSSALYDTLNLETPSTDSDKTNEATAKQKAAIETNNSHYSKNNSNDQWNRSNILETNGSLRNTCNDFSSNNANGIYNTRCLHSEETGPLDTIDRQESITVAETGVNGYIKLPVIAEEMGDGRGVPGDLHRIREDATGHLLCWGCGEFGQHGHGYKKQVGFSEGAIEMFCDDPGTMAKHVSCGSSHTAVVTVDNEIYLWGNGNSGQLGSSDLTTKLAPNKVYLYANQDKTPNIGGIACGGRHTMVWLENGHVFSFGNNFHAQLGYDFRQKNYKENQKRSDGFWDDDDESVDRFVAQPTLLKFLTHRAVVQVACGDKHSLFRFKDGGVASVGNNAHGQIGSESRDDALVPKFLDTFTQHMVHIATGSQHSLAVSEDGEMYVWGYGKACGSKQSDVLSPMKLSTSRRNIIMVAGGSSHSMALTANGSVYTWGSGHDGQLGHGDKVRFVAYPRRIKDRHIYSKCIQISCGENFSAAVTEKGLLYMWGKNSHTILPTKPTTHKIFLPYGINKNFRGGRLYKVLCGSWHAVALIGRPELLVRDGEESGESDSENVPTQEEVDAIFKNGSVSDDSDDVALPNLDSDYIEAPGRLSRREDTKLEREKTSVSLADFYAPTPDLKNPRSPSPEFYNHSEDEPKTDRAGLNTSRSATLIVQLPVQPMTTYTDAACSPMTLTTTSSMKSSSVTTSSRVPSPIHELPVKLNYRASRGILKPEKKFKEFDPAKYEKEKLRITTPILSEVVQFSKTSADAFTLPREPTSLARKHVDFSEMEEIRLKGPKSPERISRGSRHRESPLKYREMSPSKLKEPLSSRTRMRPLDSSLSHKSDSALMESPLFKNVHTTRNVSSTEQPKKPWNVNSPDEDRHYRHHVPRQLPKKYKPPRSSDSNFGLQISRSKTIVTPLQADAFDSPDRMAQLRRYAAMHNPQATSGRGINEKLKPIQPRQASIPNRRTESPLDEADQLFIGSLGSPNKPSFSSGSTWRDKSDFDKVHPPRKMAAGIVRMYITNNELIGGVDNPLYSTISDGRGQGDPLLDGDPFIVQPLLKKKVPKLEETPTLQLPELTNTHNINTSLKEASKRSENKLEIDTELDTNFTTTPRLDVVDSRVS